jgi:hypothetical protein
MICSFSRAVPGSARGVSQFATPPDWLMRPASAVLDDLQVGQPIPGVQVVSTPIAELNGLTLDLLEPSQAEGELRQLPDDLDPDEPTSYGGGNWVPRSLTGADLLVLVAEILQDDLAETAVAWGQARPPCPEHPHPAQPAIRDGEAWWLCGRDDRALYRIGRGEAPTRLDSPTAWHQESRRARKRRHH